ncbi:non-homologous end-joining DNA ligase [Amycolatopsis sp. SID8362]|uniref:non-homologous end-joining DNA ligase n=1 Tax=Amycolatopsis sp. SID8362 TaxID=2690346 RepID=UPI0013D0BDA0|nr:non-homologous end-joining DNA ligase [Amycolatopsis sp. SID8362]NED46603.1 ATP-dependent DNA ligase [Amycolatopsis sp. SID8362]
MAGSRITVRVGERQLTLSNLEKVLYPRHGFTKGEVLDYYTRIAPLLLPHIRDRAMTFVRFPDGVDGGSFFEKDVSRHAPEWVRTARLTVGGRGGDPEVVAYPLINDLPELVWAANLAALELHVHQWTVGPDDERSTPDRLVFDLDPGPGATVVDCSRVAERLRDVLTGHGFTPVAKTSGAKGMQVYAGVETDDPAAPSRYAKALAERLAAETPDLVVARMTKNLRPGKVFIDWSQNNPFKTTVAPYSLRGRDEPTVSTPVTWDEVRACRHVAHLRFTADDVLTRVADTGDLFADLDRTRVPIPAFG